MRKPSMKKRTSKLLQVILLTLIIGMMSATGAMAAKAGWNTISGKTYYYVKSGTKLKKVTGLYKINGGYYYFDKSSGVMQKGWQKIDNAWYYFSAGGGMQTGWQKINNTWYYFRSGGAMVTGRQQIDGKWYTFSSGGALQ